MYQTLLRCFETETIDMLPMLEQDLTGYGYKPTYNSLHLYTPGTIPILLVAHVDTVHLGPPNTIYHDERKGCLWSPDGLGADDRAGVFGILEILRRGFRPHVLFTDEEECGGHGANETINTWDAPDVNLIIQLDRMNSKDAVWYDCENNKAEKWVNKYGFKTAHGSFSDISILAPEWHIAAVNLSIGYYNQHTDSEHLVLGEAMATIDKVCEMLANPPKKRFQYHAKKRMVFSNSLKVGESWQWKNSTPSHLDERDLVDTMGLNIDEDICEGCEQLTLVSEMVPYHGDILLCLNCAEEVGIVDKIKEEAY